MLRTKLATSKVPTKLPHAICMASSSSPLRKPSTHAISVSGGLGPYQGGVNSGSLVAQMFAAGEFDVATFVFNQFKSAMTQIVTRQQLIPPPAPEAGMSAGCETHCSRSDLASDASRALSVPALGPLPTSPLVRVLAHVPLSPAGAASPGPLCSWHRPTAHPASLLLI